MRGLSHQKLCRSVEAYLDGEADPVLAARARTHLADCWWCSEDGEWLLLTKAALRNLGKSRPVELAAARLRSYGLTLLEHQ